MIYAVVLSSGTISNSYSTGAVFGSATNIGGLVGGNSGGNSNTAIVTGVSLVAKASKRR